MLSVSLHLCHFPEGALGSSTLWGCQPLFARCSGGWFPAALVRTPAVIPTKRRFGFHHSLENSHDRHQGHDPRARARRRACQTPPLREGLLHRDRWAPPAPAVAKRQAPSPL